jgi:hypothetical protein
MMKVVHSRVVGTEEARSPICLTVGWLGRLAMALVVCGAAMAAIGWPAFAQSLAPDGVEIVQLPLVAWVGSRDHALPNTLPDFAETDMRLATFRALTNALSAHDWTKAREIAPTVSYQIVALQEANTWFVVASDDSRTGRGPTLVVNAAPRRDVLFEAPHVPFELGTGEQAVILLRDLGGRAALVSGAHRCASRKFTSCDGKTAVCGSLEAYRDSDVGHHTGTFFNAAHVVFSERWSASIVVSLHGMKQDEGGTTQMIISNGIRGDDNGQATAATKLRLTLGRNAPAGTVVDCNYAPDEVFKYRKLCGFTNVQGRHVNGAVDACRRSVDTGTGRFVHLEQDWHVLRPYAQNWSRLDGNALAKAILDSFSTILPTAANP